MTPQQEKDQTAKAADSKSAAASSDTPPRDPTQRIPDIALARYLGTGPEGSANYSNPQL